MRGGPAGETGAKDRPESPEAELPIWKKGRTPFRKRKIPRQKEFPHPRVAGGPHLRGGGKTEGQVATQDALTFITTGKEGGGKFPRVVLKVTVVGGDRLTAGEGKGLISCPHLRKREGGSRFRQPAVNC